MDVLLLRCLAFLLSFGIVSGTSAQVITRTQRYNTLEGQELYASTEATTSTMHDTYPTIIGGPTDDVPTLDPSPTTPTTTPSTTPMTGPPTMPTTPMTGPPTIPTTGPPPIPTTGPPTTTTTPTPMPPLIGDGGGGGGGSAGGGGGGSAGGGGGGSAGGGGGGSAGGGGGGGGSWCVASSSASEKALQVGLDYACGYGGADCSQIQPGASCFNPDTIRDHASFAYNSYYQKNPTSTSCDFGGTAQVVSTDPSSGSCHFPSKGSASPTPTTPTMQTPPAMLSPPSPPSTLMPGTPFGGTTPFGPEPTASPNMATTTSQQLLLILSSTSILLYVLLANPV